MRDDDFDRRDETVEDEDEAPRSNTYAVISLVLGILSICTGLLMGIPAVIFGVLGLSRANQLRGSGRGMAITGIVLGCCSLLFTVLAIALLLPAVQKVRQAASRVQGMNNAKLVTLAIFDYDGKNGMPRAVYNPNKANFPPEQGLSWRVGLLPYLEQDALHRSFNLKQSWDSPANMALSNTVVLPYTNADEISNQTRFQAFVGPGTAFDPALKSVSLNAPSWMPDGTSNTLLYAEIGTQVPWAAPRDVMYQPNGPLPAMGRPGQSTFLVAMADGSVRNVNKNVKPNVLHAVIQCKDGTLVPVNWED